MAADGYREAIADSGEAPITPGITNGSPFLNSLLDQGVLRYGVNFVSDRSRMQSGETGGYAAIKGARLTIMQAPPLYHTTGEVLGVISTPGLERIARFFAYFVKEVDKATGIADQSLSQPRALERLASRRRRTGALRPSRALCEDRQAEMRKLALAPDDDAPRPPARGQRIRRKAATSSDREYVQGFERGVSVIKTFGAKRPHLTVTEVAAHTGLTRAVARRYLLTLERLGYVTATGPYYALTPRVLEIGFAYMSTMTVAEVARPFMAHVVDTLHESCSVGVLDGYDVFYVARTNPQRIMTTNLAIGSRLPAHATAMGHVLLAYLPPPALEAYLATRRSVP